MKLVVAEKPSVARDLARVLGATQRQKGALASADWVVTWCIGHLVELDEPETYDASWKRWSFATLPMLPETFRLRPAKRTLDQWRIVRDLLKRRDFTAVVNACDAGREGELIFRYVHERAKSKLPIERLWISSLTPAAIKQGFARLQPGSRYDGLAQAARCRSQADWLVGLNATRAMTLTLPRGSVYSIGRVQTPTLAIIVDREHEITRFEPRAFWEMLATVGQPATRDASRDKRDHVHAKWRAKTGASRLGTEALAQRLHGRVLSRCGSSPTELHVTQVVEKEARERPPQLFDLTSLQRKANVRFGFSAKRTLEGLQSLYERKKAITYPRTSSRYLGRDQQPTLGGLVGKFAEHASYGEHAKRLGRDGLRLGRRVIDDAKVTDHHAIIPTGKMPSLDGDEAKLFDLVVRRFLAAFHEDARFHTTRVVLSSDQTDPPKTARSSDEILEDLPPEPDHFVGNGRVVIEPGWQHVEPPRKSTQPTWPRLSVGDRVPVTLRTPSGSTKPPPRFTDASLLAAMETAGKLVDDEALREAMKACGLGTPATRAAIIETLIRREYVRRSGKTMCPTDKGVALIAGLPVPTLRSAELTGAWEARLQEVADDKLSAKTFMDGVHTLVEEAVSALRARGAPPVDATPIGRCPRCQGQVCEGRASFACKACHFAIQRRIAGRPITVDEARQLLSRGRTGLLTGFRSKKKRRFRAALTLEGGDVTLSFPGKKKAEKKPPERRRPEASADLGALVCPGCGRTGLIPGKRAWGCAAWRDGCKFVVPFVFDGKKLTVKELVDLLTKGKTRKAKFESGKARLHLEGTSVSLRTDP